MAKFSSKESIDADSSLPLRLAQLLSWEPAREAQLIRLRYNNLEPCRFLPILGTLTCFTVSIFKISDKSDTFLLNYSRSYLFWAIFIGTQSTLTTHVICFPAFFSPEFLCSIFQSRVFQPCIFERVCAINSSLANSSPVFSAFPMGQVSWPRQRITGN